jgi:hypothetical protein
MKNGIKLISIIALAAVIGFTMAACSDELYPAKPPTPKVIETDFRGSILSAVLDLSEHVTDLDIDIIVGESSISWTGDDADSLTGVYTEGGDSDISGKWAYLYKDGAKIGVVITDYTDIILFIGKYSTDYSTYINNISPTIDLTGISDYPSIMG